MSIYLVDFENVNSQGLAGIGTLDSSDSVVIFYSDQADSMTFDLHQQINQSKAYIFFQKVDVGTKNALDFQLATYLGYSVCENEKAGKETAYYVVTKDRGFQSLVAYWTKRGVDVSLVGKIHARQEESPTVETTEEAADSVMMENAQIQESSAESMEQEPKEEPEKEAAVKPETKKTVTRRKRTAKKEQSQPDELRIEVEKVISDKSNVDLVTTYIRKYKTKLGINNALAKEFKDSKKASEIYKEIKPLIADKKGQ